MKQRKHRRLYTGVNSAHLTKEGMKVDIKVQKALEKLIKKLGDQFDSRDLENLLVHKAMWVSCFLRLRAETEEANG